MAEPLADIQKIAGAHTDIEDIEWRRTIEPQPGGLLPGASHPKIQITVLEFVVAPLLGRAAELVESSEIEAL